MIKINSQIYTVVKICTINNCINLSNYNDGVIFTFAQKGIFRKKVKEN